MKKPEYQETGAPEEVISFAKSVKQIPKRYYGLEYEYKHIAYPEAGNGLLAIRFYETEKILEGDVQEEFMAYIDPAACSWMVRRKNGKWGKATLESMYISPDSTKLLHPETVRQFPQFDSEDAVRKIRKWQLDINRSKLKKKQKEKDRRINELMSQAKPLTDGYIKWHEETAMGYSRYLIYNRSNKKHFRAFCTHCGTYMEVPAAGCKNGKKSKCPACGSRVTMKSRGRTANLLDCGWTEYVQAIENGIMIRFIRIKKDYSEWGNPKRRIDEPCRVVIEAGKKAQWYEVRDSNTVFGSESVYQKNRIKGCVHGASYPAESMFCGVYRKDLKKQLKKGFPYHMFWEYRKSRNRNGEIKQYELYDYFEAYSFFPLMESLQKTGRSILVNCLCRKNYKEFDNRAGTLHGMLKIPRQQLKKLDNPTIEQLKICREINRMGVVLGRIELKMLEERVNHYKIEDELRLVMKYMSLRKFMKYIFRKDKYEIRNYYYDYIRMGERLGYDFTNKFVLFPKRPKEAHDTALNLISEEKMKKRMQEECRHDNQIAAVEKKIRKDFSFQDDQFVIFPAKSSREIIMEGQSQHHCVGAGSYIKKMAEGKAYILFLRKRENPETPFYTVEMSKNHRIIQRHGKYNQEGDEVREVDRFLKKFVEAKENGKKYHAKK